MKTRLTLIVITTLLLILFLSLADSELAMEVRAFFACPVARHILINKNRYQTGAKFIFCNNSHTYSEGSLCQYN